MKKEKKEETTASLTKEEAKALLLLLDRVNLRGGEVESFVYLQHKLKLLAK